MIGRNIRTQLPCIPQLLRPKWPKYRTTKQNDVKSKNKQSYFFNRKHNAKNLPKLNTGDKVKIKIDTDKKWGESAMVTNANKAHRTYIVQTNSGKIFRRNRKHLLKIPKTTKNIQYKSADFAKLPESGTRPITRSMTQRV